MYTRKPRIIRVIKRIYEGYRKKASTMINMYIRARRVMVEGKKVGRLAILTHTGCAPDTGQAEIAQQVILPAERAHRVRVERKTSSCVPTGSCLEIFFFSPIFSLSFVILTLYLYRKVIKRKFFAIFTNRLLCY